MDDYSLSHLSDHALELDLAAAVSRDRATTASLLAHLAEFDARRLYLPAAYPSMHAYCVHELHLSEDSAYKRITAARVARQFPTIFEALAEGRLHLAAVGLLSPYLKPENANELLKAAAHKSKSEIEELLAKRFPRSEMMALVTASSCQLAPGRVAVQAQHAQLAPERVEAMAPQSKVAPIAAQRFELRLSIGQGTYDKLQYAQSLLSHQVASGDVARVLERGLDALIQKLEKQKLAATSKPRSKQRPTKSRRHIPARVRRAVWERDGGQCTFVGESGRRCASRTRLELDHVDEVALGGKATVEGIRLRCRAHNQYTAECTFGKEFMRHKAS